MSEVRSRAPNDREFHMSDEDFSHLSKLAYQYTGIVLADHKRDMLYGRLVRRLRELNFPDFVTYRAYLTENSEIELSKFINAITTNLTSFFRENHHFEYLAETLCAQLADTLRTTGRVRGWSAGCSTGEEAYSISITLNRYLNLRGGDCKILATDLDSKVIQHGSQGIYAIERIESLDQELKKKWFLQDRNHPDIVKVKPSVQKLVHFKRLNLLESWPMKGDFDFIFCRNVMIYFDVTTQEKLLNGFADKLKDNGYLFIGHSESLNKVADRFKPIGRTIYQKIR